MGFVSIFSHTKVFGCDMERGGTGTARREAENRWHEEPKIDGTGGPLVA
jgi:hypothetical protein